MEKFADEDKLQAVQACTNLICEHWAYTLDFQNDFFDKFKNFRKKLDLQKVFRFAEKFSFSEEKNDFQKKYWAFEETNDFKKTFQISRNFLYIGKKIVFSEIFSDYLDFSGKLWILLTHSLSSSAKHMSQSTGRLYFPIKCIHKSFHWQK